MFLYVHNEFSPEPAMSLATKKAPGFRYIEYFGAPLYLLPRTVPELEASKSSKYWYNLRRAQKQFESEFGKLEFSWIRQEGELEFWLPKVHELFLARWSDRYISSPWKTIEGFNSYGEALKKLAREGRASLAVLSRGGELLSFSYNLHQDGVFYFYQHATKEDARYRKFSLGKIFLTNLLREVITTQQFAAFDFMVGEAGYKYEWADRTQRVFLQIRRRENETSLGFLARVAKARLQIRIQKNEPLKNFILRVIQIPKTLKQKWTIKALPTQRPATAS